MKLLLATANLNSEWNHSLFLKLLQQKKSSPVPYTGQNKTKSLQIKTAVYFWISLDQVDLVSELTWYAQNSVVL